MTKPGMFTLQEIKSQTEAWAAVLEAAQGQAQAWQAFFDQDQAGPTIFFGCGSTHYLSMTAAAVLQLLTGRAARAVPSAELFLFPQAWLPVNAPITGVAVSRSGTTTETLRAADHLTSRYEAQLACVTCYEDTPLAEKCDFTLVSPKGQEESVAQTRSFSSMLVGCLALAGLAGKQPDYLERLSTLPELGQRLLQTYEALAQSLGEDSSISQVFFLGSGPRYGLASETMLKLKEMSLTTSEAYHFLEFRHGPKSMVDEQTLIIGLLSDTAREAEAPVLREMKALGAKVLVVGEARGDMSWADHVVAFESGLPEVSVLPLYLPVLQLFAYYRAVGKGLDPDSPRNLDAVVEL